MQGMLMTLFAEMILVKTPRGSAEMAQRSGALSSLERRLLILIDGQRTVADLADMLDRSRTAFDFQQALTALERGRYVDRLEEMGHVA